MKNIQNEGNINDKEQISNIENYNVNIESAPSTFEEINTTSKDDETNIRIDSNYKFYCVIEVYEYQTNQMDISYGMRNPIEEITRLC